MTTESIIKEILKEDYIEIKQGKYKKERNPKNYGNYIRVGFRYFEYKPKPRCKLCNEVQPIYISNMCDICYTYLTARMMRIGKQSFEDAFKEDNKEVKK